MSARSLRLIAPFRCQFDLDSATMIEQYEPFNTFLKELNSDFQTARKHQFPDVPQGVVIEAELRSHEADAESRYVSLAQAGSLFNSPKYLSVSFDEIVQQDIKQFLKDAAQEADTLCGKMLSEKLSPVQESVDVAIYDNTIAILTLDVTVGSEFVDDDWNRLDEWTTHLVFFFLGRLYKQFIYPTLCAINRYADSRSEKRIRNPRDYGVFYDISTQEPDPARARLLWINRTLICPQGQVPSHWARRNTDMAHAIDADDALAHLSWGNNVIETTHSNRAHDLSCIWQGMYLAQYYYAVLDVTSKNLKRFIAITYDKKTNQQLRRLSRTMDAVINAVTIFQVEYKDFSKELQGLPKNVFRRLEKEWDFEALFENVQGKCNLCKSQIQLMNDYINQRNSARVEMVLTGVAGVGFVGLMINLSSYGRALLRDGPRNDVVGLLDIGQYLPPNLMVWIGVVLALAVSLFVSANRTR